MYKVLRKILFWFPAESVHHFSMGCLRFAEKVPGIPQLLRPSASKEVSLQKEIFGLKFSNPVGLGAGFDKNAFYLNEIAALGFGFLEIGTVTPRAQPGNDRPRLFRIPEHKALINRMGFNNDGVNAVAHRLRVWRRAGKNQHLIIGGNIGKNKATENEDAWKDYEICFRELFDSVDYFVVNVSSPNTPGLRQLQDRDALYKILSHLQTINRNQAAPKPLLLKIAPDLSQKQLDDVISLATEIKLDGIVATNTTIARTDLFSVPKEKIEAIGAGGLSGLPLKQRATEVIREIHTKSNGQIPIIGSGGIFTTDDAKEKINAGASLVQVWTGFIYEGPGIVKKLCEGLRK